MPSKNFTIFGTKITFETPFELPKHPSLPTTHDFVELAYVVAPLLMLGLGLQKRKDVGGRLAITYLYARWELSTAEIRATPENLPGL